MSSKGFDSEDHARPPLSSDDTPTQSVGYRRPPKHSQFKPGQSGNPKGRPKGANNLAGEIRKVFTDTVVLREGEKVRRVSRLVALYRKQLEQGLKGDHRATQAAFKTAMALGLFKDNPTTLSGLELATMMDQRLKLDFLSQEELKEYIRLTKKAYGED
jgi:Family of unknown function (DUF5681)